MDTFVLLPFLLLSSVPTDVNIWRYGPEYTYTVDIYMTDPTGPLFSYHKAINVSTTLKCRPQESDCLNCRLDDIKTAMLENGDDAKVQNGYVGWQHRTPFQINFDNRGIRDLVVSRDASKWNVDVTRGIANLLNIGVDLLNKSDGTFNASEKSPIGECQSLVNISRYVREYEAPREENFEIIPVAWFKKAHGEVVEIEKTRDMENCTHKNEFAFPGSGKVFQAQLKSSATQIVISDTSYESNTVNEINLKIGKEVLLSMQQKISLNLVSILPAEEALPTVPNPTTVSFFAYNITA